MKVNVLRLDHRRVRDARITTHVCLTSRAFGASKVILSGDEDKKIMENIRDVVKRWGGDFEIDYIKKWDKFIDDWKNNGGEVVHLTMYGEPVQEVTSKIRESSRDKLVVVGGSRVPSKYIKKQTGMFQLQINHTQKSQLYQYFYTHFLKEKSMISILMIVN